MMSKEELIALQEKAAELSQVTGELEAKLKRTPYREDTAPLREMMENMVCELRRMDKNLQAMIRIGKESIVEGGTDNGNY